MTVKEAILNAKSMAGFGNNKFDKLLIKFLNLHQDEEYTADLFDKCWDKAVKVARCEKCNKKATKLFMGAMWCDLHI